MLVYTPSPYLDESLKGYILRVSEENGYDTPAHILSYAGYKQGVLRSSKFNPTKLQHIIGESAADLEQIVYYCPDDESTVKLLHHNLGKTARGFISSSQKICPDCVKEKGYIEAYWDLILAVVCPIHQKIAINHCDKCEQPLKLNRPGLLLCNCLKEISILPITQTPLNREIIELAGIIKAVVEAKELTTLKNTTGFSLEILKTQTLSSLLLIIEKLASFNLYSKNQPHKIKEPLTQLSEAAEVLSNWPINYHIMLKRLGLKYLSQQKDEKTTLHSQFEKFYISMFKVKHQATYHPQFLKEEFVNFGANKWGYAVIDEKFKPFLTKTENEHKFINLSQASQEIGINPTTLRKLIREGKVQPKKILSKNKRYSYIFDREKLQSLKEENKITYTARGANQYTQIPVSVLNTLKTNGFFGPQGNTSLNKASYKKTDLDNLVQHLCQKSRFLSKDNFEAEQVYNLLYILKQLRFWSKKGKGNFIESYLSGELSSIGRTADSIDSIYFDKKTVDSFAENERSCASKNFVSVKHAAKLLSCPFKAINWLMDHQFLQGFQMANRTRVNSQSIEQFKAQFIFIKELANQLSTSSIYLSAFAENAGLIVHKITLQKVTGFIDRSDGNELLLLFNSR